MIILVSDSTPCIAIFLNDLLRNRELNICKEMEENREGKVYV